MESVLEYTRSGYEYLGAADGPDGLLVSLRWPGRASSCERCGSERLHRHGWRRRRLAHAPIGVRSCGLRIEFARFRCQACGKAQSPRLPCIEPRARISAALRRFVAHALLQLNTSIARLRAWLGLGWNSLWRCLPAAANPLAAASAAELAHLCLDEVFFREPRRYLTVLSCASGRVLGLCEGRGAAPSRRLLSALPAGVIEQVETLATDLSRGQRKAAMDCLPHAQVCADHFHVARLVRRALRDTDRRDARRAAAWQLREALREDDPALLWDWLKHWRGGLCGALGKLYKTVDAWALEIESAIETGRSTGPAEALNRRIALLRRIACGYTNQRNFTQRILSLNYSPHHEG